MSMDAMVFVIDDDVALQESLKWMMSSLGFNVKTFSNAFKFIEYYDGQAGCLLVDIRMPGMSGLELQSFLIENDIQIPIIFISAHGDIPIAVRAIKKGAIDFLTKPCNDQKLLDCINKAIKLDQEARKTRTQEIKAKSCYNTLTKRERQVMACIIKGKLNKVISAELEISLKTVEAHRSNVMRKMAINSLPELVEQSIRFTLIPQEESTEELAFT